jgi:DNA-binding FrmR family transcriptional regulator
MEQFTGTDEMAKIINRLRRVEGQARGLQRMLDEGRPCHEVFTQLSATKAALDRIGTMLIAMKMNECLATELEREIPREAVEKALQTFMKYSQCVDIIADDGNDDATADRF